MEDDKIFDTEDKRKEAIEAFSNLKGRLGWQILTKVLKENIEIYTEIVLAGGSESKEYFDRLRDRIEIFEFLQNMPERMMKDLRDKEERSPEVDPYWTASQLREAEKK